MSSIPHTHPRTNPRMEHKRTPRQHLLRACRLLRIFFSTDAPHHARAVSGVFACPAPVELEGRHLRDLAGRCQLLHLVDVNLISWHEKSEAGNGAAFCCSVILTPTDPAARWCSNPDRPQPRHTKRTLTNSQSSKVPAISRNFGAIFLHGPHHVAVKSTQTSWDDHDSRETHVSQGTIDGGEEFGGREFEAAGRGAKTTQREIAPCRRQQARQTRPSTSARGIRASRSLDATRRFGA